MAVILDQLLEVTLSTKCFTKITESTAIKCPIHQITKSLGVTLGGIVIEKIGPTKDPPFMVHYLGDIVNEKIYLINLNSYFRM